MDGSRATDRLRTAHAHATAFYAGLLPRTRTAMAYLQARGLTAAVAGSPWTVGYAPPGGTALRDHLRGLGHPVADLLDAGLITTSRRGTHVDVFRDRVTFPIRDAGGQVVAFTARSLSGASWMPKYLNTRTTDIYRKSHELYGLAEQAGRAATAVLLVEGPTDVLAVAALGYLAVSPCGTAVTADQIALLSGTVRPGTPVVVTFDADTAGERAADRAYRLLRGWPGPVDAIALPSTVLGPDGDRHGGLDPAGLVGLLGPARAAEVLDTHRTTLLELLVEHRLAPYRLDEIEGRVRALRSVGVLLREVTYTVARDAPQIAGIATRLGARLDLDGGTVADAVYPADPHRGKG